MTNNANKFAYLLELAEAILVSTARPALPAPANAFTGTNRFIDDW
jgi:hypothetical protein